MTKKVDILKHPSIVITGASAGIGFAFAKYYLYKEVIPLLTTTLSALLPTTSQKTIPPLPRLLLIAHNPKNLREARSNLIELIYQEINFIKASISSPKRKSAQSIITTTLNDCIATLAVDLTKPTAPNIVVKYLKQHRLGVKVFVNNAGIGYMGEFSAMTEEKISSLLMLNVVNLTLLSKFLLPEFDTSTPNPYLINVASVVGFIPFPLMAIYGASKSYVVNFSEALARELKESHSRIKVFTLCPGSTGTGFFARSGKDLPDVSEGKFMSPEELVKITMRAVHNNLGTKKTSTLIIPGSRNILLCFLGKYLPRRWMMKLALEFMKKRLRD